MSPNIWLPILLSIVATLAAKYYFKEKLTWLEVFIPPTVTLVVILIINTICLAVTTHDTEYWGGWVVNASYYEAWDEEVPCTHAIYRTEYYDCGTSDKPATCSREVFVGYAHAYDVDYHPESWYLSTSNGGEISVDSNVFNSLVLQFGNKHFIDMHRNFHSVDGDSYRTDWKGEFNTLEPVVEEHSYVNRIANSKSLYNFPKVDPKLTPVYEYPQVSGYNCPSVLSSRLYPGYLDIDRINAKHGASSKIRIWVLIWEGDIDRQVAFDQKAYWKGSNKNELVICINVGKDTKVNWCEVFSWSESEAFKVEIVNQISSENKKLNLKELADYLDKNIPTKWTKKNWHDFDYISVDLPTWGVVLIWLFSIITTLITLIWSVVNGFNEGQ